jgi:hypothetical protein
MTYYVLDGDLQPMSIISWLATPFQRYVARLRPRLKAALVDAGLRLMGRPSTGRLTTKVVQSVVTALVRLAGLAHA